MAQMVPEDMPALLRTPALHAERLVWTALRNQLSQDFRVLWSVHVAGQPPRELDFVILHPELGILALEVKGGLVQLGNPFDRKTRWISGGRKGRLSGISNPYDQVLGGSMTLIRDCKSRLPLPDRYPVSVAVVLPHTPERAGARDILGEVSHLFAFQETLPRLGVLLADIMARARSARQGMADLGEDGVSSIVELYARQHSPGPAPAIDTASPPRGAIWPAAVAALSLLVWGTQAHAPAPSSRPAEPPPTAALTPAPLATQPAQQRPQAKAKDRAKPNASSSPAMAAPAAASTTPKGCRQYTRHGEEGQVVEMGIACPMADGRWKVMP